MLKKIFIASLPIHAISVVFLYYATLPKWINDWDSLDLILPGIWALGFIVATIIFWVVYLCITRTAKMYWWLVFFILADIIIYIRIWG